MNIKFGPLAFTLETEVETDFHDYPCIGTIIVKRFGTGDTQLELAVIEVHGGEPTFRLQNIIEEKFMDKAWDIVNKLEKGLLT